MAHTSLPWMIERAILNGRDYGIERIAPVNPDVDLCIEGSGGARSYTRTIASFVRTTDDEDNAALIVRAVNSHADLLAALKWFVDDISGTHTRMIDFDANVARARAAIKKADPTQ